MHLSALADTAGLWCFAVVDSAVAAKFAVGRDHVSKGPHLRIWQLSAVTGHLAGCRIYTIQTVTGGINAVSRPERPGIHSRHRLISPAHGQGYFFASINQFVDRVLTLERRSARKVFDAIRNISLESGHSSGHVRQPDHGAPIHQQHFPSSHAENGSCPSHSTSALLQSRRSVTMTVEAVSQAMIFSIGNTPGRKQTGTIQKLSGRSLARHCTTPAVANWWSPDNSL